MGSVPGWAEAWLGSRQVPEGLATWPGKGLVDGGQPRLEA